MTTSTILGTTPDASATADANVQQPISQLSPIHEQHLANSAIAEQVRLERGYRSLAPGAVQPTQILTGGVYSKDLLKTILHQGALAFPLYRLGQETPYTWIL